MSLFFPGNLVAEIRMGVVARALAYAGIHPGRLSVQWMSSAEGARFVQVTTALIEEAKQLGPLGQSEEKDPAVLRRRLTAIRRTLEGKKLRWVIGKAWEFKQKGNLYGEVFTQHELNRCFDEIILDECTLQEISLILEAGPLSAKRLAELLEQPPPKVLRHLSDMRRMGWGEVAR